MNGYLYVADESGAEIEGSRRSLARIETIGQYRRLWFELEALAGEGCTVKASDDADPFDLA